MARTIPRFTPSLLQHDELERLFVVRNELLDRVMDRIERAGSSDGRDHTLLVGPRGAGKTHLVSLVYYRTKAALDALGVQVAWLDEDPWLVLSFDALLAQIWNRLEPEPESSGSTPDDLTAAITTQAAEHGPIVVIAENFDQILDQIDEIGQQKLRNLAQGGSLVLVATTTTLSHHLAQQDAPFYGFMSVTHLEPFDVDEATEMLTSVAEFEDDAELVRYLADAGTARVAVIEHLAGGQPRMWATFSTALDIRALDNLVEHLMATFDELTPYYQEQLGRLGPHQRLVVASLGELDRPVATVELARQLGIDQRSLSKTISELRDRGWVQPSTSPFLSLLDGRLTYYELAEPLARLAFQVKATRGEPLRVLVDFLKGWFDQPSLDSAAPETDIGQRYLEMAQAEVGGDSSLALVQRLTRLPEYRQPIMNELVRVDKALGSLEAGDPAPFFALPSPLRGALERRVAEDGVPQPDDLLQLRLAIHADARSEAGRVPDDTTGGWIDRALDLVTAQPEHPPVLVNAASWLGTGWRFEEVAMMNERISKVAGADHPDTLSSRNNLALAYDSAGRYDDAIILHEKTLADFERVLGPDHPHTLNSRNNLANSYNSAGRHDDAITLHTETLADFERVLGPDHPHTLNSRNNLAASYDCAGRHDDAIILHETTLTDREHILGPDHPHTLNSRNNLANSYNSAGRHDDAINLDAQTLTDRERILGPDHPHTLDSRNNLAASYHSAGRHDDAINLHTHTLTDRERILGPDHPHTLASRNNLAASYQSAGRRDDSITLHERNLSDSERILGPDHPHTLTSRNNLALAYTSAGRHDDAITIADKA